MVMLVVQTEDRNSLLRSSLFPRWQHGYLGESDHTETGKYEQNTVRYETHLFH